MSTEMLGLIAVALINGIIGIFIALINRKASRVEVNQIKVGEKIAELEKNTNSIKDALVASTALVSHAEGKLEGKAEAKAEQAVFAKGELAEKMKPKG